jgi:hypothetical protein
MSAEAPACTRKSPQRKDRNPLFSPGIPAYSRPDRRYRDRPVTPEVAGSSPVAPVSRSTCKRASSVALIGGIRGSRRRRLLPGGNLVLSSFRENDLQRGQFRALGSRWCSGQPRKTGHSPARRLRFPRLAVSDEIFLRLLGLGMATAIFRQSPPSPDRTGSACPWGRRWRCAASPLRGGA